MEFMQDPIWFSPLNVFHHANQLQKATSLDDQKRKEFRKVLEAKITAIMLVGFVLVGGKKYWLQLVDDKEGSPDIRTIMPSENDNPKFDFFDQHDVEVVEYEAHSNGDIADFLLNSKFSKMDAYDAKTHILCHISLSAKFDMPSLEEDLEKQMSQINTKSQIYLLIPTAAEGRRYGLIALKPKVQVLVEFNPEEELFKWGAKDYPGVRSFVLGSRKPGESRPNEKHYPFEKLGYVPNSQGEYQ